MWRIACTTSASCELRSPNARGNSCPANHSLCRICDIVGRSLGVCFRIRPISDAHSATQSRASHTCRRALRIFRLMIFGVSVSALNGMTPITIEYSRAARQCPNVYVAAHVAALACEQLRRSVLNRPAESGEHLRRRGARAEPISRRRATRRKCYPPLSAVIRHIAAHNSNTT